MKKGSQRLRRRFVLSGESFLEDRVLMSTIGRSTRSPLPADVGSLPHISHAVVYVGPTKVQPLVRAANHLSGRSVGTDVSPTVKRWSWLANTYWFVPAIQSARGALQQLDGTSDTGQ